MINANFIKIYSPCNHCEFTSIRNYTEIPTLQLYVLRENSIETFTSMQEGTSHLNKLTGCGKNYFTFYASILRVPRFKPDTSAP